MLIQFERSLSLLRFQFNETNKTNSDSLISFINTTKLLTT